MKQEEQTPVQEAKDDKVIKERMYKHLSPKANAKEQKQFRSKQRRKMQAFVNEIILASKQNKKAELSKSVKAFISFYKKDYLLNDFSLASIYQGSKETKVAELGDMLKIVKSNMKGQ